MPCYSVKLRKIRASVNKQYPGYSKKRKEKIVSGIVYGKK
jgi:hypothetical protein